MTKIITRKLTDLSEVLEFERQTAGPDPFMGHPRLYILGFFDGVVKVGITGRNIKQRLQAISTVRRNNGNDHGISMISLTIPHINAYKNENIILRESGFVKAYGEYLKDDFMSVNSVLYGLDLRTEYTEEEEIENARICAGWDRVLTAIRTGNFAALPGAVIGPSKVTKVN